MPATAAISVSSAIQAATPRASSIDPRGSGDAASTFDSHLDSARQQRHQDAAGDVRDSAAADREARAASRKETRNPNDATDAADSDKAASGDSTATTAAAPAKPAVDTQADLPAEDPAVTAGKPGDAIDAGTLTVAGAMLALLGQAMPASASAATGGAAKVMAASVPKTSIGQPHAAALPADASADALANGASTTASAATSASVDASAQGAKALAGSLFGTQSPKLAQQDADPGKLQDLSNILLAPAQSSAVTTVAAPHALSIASPAGSAAFAQELGQQVAWLGNQDVKQAKIRLHPEDLGQLDVKVSVQHNGQVDVTFAAQHPAAVHALQQTLPQLDALLAQHGLSLGQADVGQRQTGGDGRSSNGFGSGNGDTLDAADAAIDGPTTVSSVGLLDAFA